jgi:hypothetical protein
MDYFMHDLQNYEVRVVYYVDGGFPESERERFILKDFFED